MNTQDKIKLAVNWEIKKMDKRYGILVVSVTILVLCFVAAASATTWSVDGSGGADFTGIQEAINTASVGDTIIVHSGVYYENVVVDKSVTLIGNGQPVVDAEGKGNAISLTADGITLVGFTATNSESSWGCAGIKVISSNNTITGNNVRNNWNGICLDNSSNNTITRNKASSNDGGIFLRESSNNTITGNTFLNDGFRVSYSYQNTVKDNTVNGKPLVYLEDVSDYKVEDAGQVILVNCTNISVENLDLSATSEGIELWETEDSKVVNNTVSNNNGDGISLYESSNNNTITGNNVCNNRNGIYLDNSSNNTITWNNASSNTWGGIRLWWDSSNNTITGNNASSNDDGIRLWDSSNNTITGNNASNNNYNGICLFDSSNNTITGNDVSNNKDCGIAFDGSNNTITGNTFVNDGLRVSYSYQNTVKDNTVNGKPLVYLEDVSDYKVEDAGQVIIVNCNNITIENLDLSNTSGGIALWKTENSKISNNTVCNNDDDGIYLYFSSNNIITGNNASNNNRNGIYLSDSSNNNTITGNNASNNGDYGIILYDSNNNTLTGNNVSNNRGGIYLSDSSNNTLTGNNVCNNGDYGISLRYSSNNTITGNTFINDGLFIDFSYQNIVEDNIVNAKPLVYLEDASDYKVEDAGQIILVNCNNITVENLDLSSTNVGIELLGTENSKISNNTVCNNNIGIGLYSSSNNTIIGNTANSNHWNGIKLWDSSNNHIYLNNFINNTNNVDSLYSTNIWNSPLEITYTYGGNAYTHYVGNYWGNYKGTDADGDGIGDTSYSIDSDSDEKDDYPLMKSFENYILTTSAPA